MARKTDIQYINFYTDGSAARKYELQKPSREEHRAETAEQPRQPRTRKRTVICVDPLALSSILVSAVMLVLMVVGVARYFTINQQEQAAQAYVESLQAENDSLREAYESGYDPAQIEQDALALGMIPVEQATHITVQVSPVEIEPVQETNVWEELWAFFASLFA